MSKLEAFLGTDRVYDVAVPAEIHSRIKVISNRRGIAVNELMTMAVLDFVTHDFARPITPEADHLYPKVETGTKVVDEVKLPVGGRIKRYNLPDPDDCSDTQLENWFKTVESDTRKLRKLKGEYAKEQNTSEEVKVQKVLNEYERVRKKLEKRIAAHS